MTTVGALDKAHELRTDIPSDAALIGHDDASFASLVCPQLTTIRHPAAEMGRPLLIECLCSGRDVQKAVHLRAEFGAGAFV